MPREFTLYQTIPSEKLKAGTYRVSCRLWNESGKEGTCRLFANNEVQYFATNMDYVSNLTEGEQATFASYIAELNETNMMQEVYVYVYVAVQEGEDLTIGIRSGSKKSNGMYASGSDNSGYFLVDYFRIERISDEITQISDTKQSDSAFSPFIYDLQGRAVGTDLNRLPQGIDIQNGKKVARW